MFIISIIVSVLITGICSVIFPTEYKLIEKHNLLALNGNNKVSGNFFLGTGHINSEMKYYYIIKQKNGKIIKTVSYNNIVIFNSENPKIEKYKKVYKNKLLNKLIFDPLFYNKYRIYIPKNSIKNKYELPPFN